MRVRFILIPMLALAAASPVMAQLGLPSLPLPPVRDVLDPVTGAVVDITEDVRRSADRLARQRLGMIERLVARNPETIELDRNGAPARRGELLVMDGDAAGVARAEAAGFRVLNQETLYGLDIAVTRFAVPAGTTLAEGEQALGALLPQAIVAPDNLHREAGGAVPIIAANATAASAAITAPVGMIDGGPAGTAAVRESRGFARGAPLASDHGNAIASLLESTGVTTIRAADVYGSDPAGGNALAIARALGWLAERDVKVVTISLVGPRNAVLERAVASILAKGVVIVAPVGNDGPASPPSYPASYDGVVAVTGVDGRRRVLIEAGRALHLDYAAPAADIGARNAKGRKVKVRGTSFAVPLVAARIAAGGQGWRASLDQEARDLGERGPDQAYGRGLICGACRGVR